MLTHMDDVPAEERSVGDIRATRQMLGPAAGSVEIGASRWQIPAGARNAPAHVHATEEEIFYVLAGEGFAWRDGQAYAVGPGDVDTEMMAREWELEGERRGMDPAMVREEYRERLILKRLERPDDIAGAVAFLCSPAADQITASHLIVSGGLPYHVASA